MGSWDDARLSLFVCSPPSWTELVIPGISILTVIGIIPFMAAAARQVWVKYKITSRRISVQSGIGGNDFTEIIYPVSAAAAEPRRGRLTLPCFLRTSPTSSTSSAPAAALATWSSLSR